MLYLPHVAISLALLSLVNGEELNCFINHRNIRIDCAKPIERRSGVSLEDCQKFCLSRSEECLSAQYDYYRKNCDIYTVPSPFTEQNNETAARLKRELVLNQAENKPDTSSDLWSGSACSFPTLQPSIGTAHLVPRIECLLEQKHSSFRLHDLKSNKNHNADTKTVQNSDSKIQSSIASPPNPFSPLAVEVLPIVPDCPVGETARVQIIDGVEVANSDTVVLLLETVDKCIHACRTSTYPDGSRLPLLCRSAHYNKVSLKCFVYSDALNPNGYLEYKPNSHVTYMEKVCISEDLLPLSCDDAFRRVPQHVLLGHAAEIITSTSQSECIRECIQSKDVRNLDCKSIIHYIDFALANCILNIHTRSSRPEFFLPELRYKVDYVELSLCSITPTTESLKGRLRISDLVKNERVTENLNSFTFSAPRGPGTDQVFGGVGSVEPEWSEWSICNTDTSTRLRQRQCPTCLEKVQIQPCFSSEHFNDNIHRFVKEQELKESPLHQENAKHPASDIIPFPSKESLDLPHAKNEIEFFGPPFESTPSLTSDHVPKILL